MIERLHIIVVTPCPALYLQHNFVFSSEDSKEKLANGTISTKLLRIVFASCTVKNCVAHIFLLHKFSELRIIVPNTLIVHPVLPK